MEQIQHTADGWVENRKNIDPKYLPLYDSQMQDVMGQFASQDVHIDLQLEDNQTDEASQAAALIYQINRNLEWFDIDPHEYQKIKNQINELKTILFG